MKIRNGFVSNSSSSSFIVAVKNREETKINIEVDLRSYSEYFIEDVEGLRKYFGNMGYDTDEEVAENKNYQKCKKAIEDGQMVMAGSFSDDGDGTEYMLCKNGLKKVLKNNDNIMVILSEAGY